MRKSRNDAPSGTVIILGVLLLAIIATALFIWANIGEDAAPRVGASQPESSAKVVPGAAPQGSAAGR